MQPVPEGCFRDGRGRLWMVESPIGWEAVHRVRSLASVDLLSNASGTPPLPAADQARTVLALWAIVRPEAQHAGISQAEFIASMQEPDLQAAAMAVVLEAAASGAT